jgi:hypothetical protein
LSQHDPITSESRSSTWVFISSSKLQLDSQVQFDYDGD